MAPAVVLTFNKIEEFQAKPTIQLEIGNTVPTEKMHFVLGRVVAPQVYFLATLLMFFSEIQVFMRVCMGITLITELMRVAFPAWEIDLLFHPSNL